jgi:Protein of unknown function (DUF3237)
MSELSASSLPVPGLELLFRVDAKLGPLEDHGLTRAGHRRVIPIVGGTIRGAIDAEILPSGADWQLVLPDGTIDVDTRYSARTVDGEYIHLRTRGVRSGPRSVLESILAGVDVGPTAYYFRLQVEVETADPGLAMLQRSVIVASAARTADRVIYDAYRVT